ncbi:hypothetical protein MKX03_028241 [Papaver bracteatum]|nr:hypothetical protein MKX03_028241 [Papaver bracteatum]
MAKVVRRLRNVSAAFIELADTISQNLDVETEDFARASALVAPFLGYLGFAFKFAEMDYVPKVADLAEASKSFMTLEAMLDRDVEQNTVRLAGSHSRNLLRIKRAIDTIRSFFKLILTTEYGDMSLKDLGIKAYDETLAPYHGWALRKAVHTGMFTLPTKAQFLKKVNQDEASARIDLESYVDASAIVIQYVDKLFLSRELGTEW